MTASSPKARVAFKDRDVPRLIKAARAAGINPTAVEVDVKAGLIRVISGKSDDTGSDLDKWLKEHHEGPSQGH
jgi:Tfp pilus assembly PilM family ATPase